MMRISTRGRYAVRIMVYMAMAASAKPAKKKDIAKAEEISPAYVEQILMRLKMAGLVQSFRGAKGGFAMNRRPEDITVREVLDVTEGPVALAPCTTERCSRATLCVTRAMWHRAGAALNDLFGGTTVAQLAQEAKALKSSLAAESYDI